MSHDNCEEESISPSEKQDMNECLEAARCDFVASFTSTSTSSSFHYYKDYLPNYRQPTKPPPNIEHEVDVAKSILQECSTISGDNLFDHLSDLIKRVIDERPPNVIDFFEEFSRNAREQKFHLPERFPPDSIYEESNNYRIAKALLKGMKLPSVLDPEFDICEEESMEEEYMLPARHTRATGEDTSDLPFVTRPLTLDENVLHMQFYWALCGFGFNQDEIYQLSCTMQKLQQHPTVTNCRFWGRIYGLKASYYVAEVSLTKQEIEKRQEKMQLDLQYKMENSKRTDEDIVNAPAVDMHLIPGGIGWDDYPIDEMAKMKPEAAAIPTMLPAVHFDVPPETVGSGLNRHCYFVTTSLLADWLELPIITPKQVEVAKQIKKFFTGDLEADIDTYPRYPGKEKHFLRATIARITAGTYIAPSGYYRKMTKKERRLLEGLGEGEEEEEEEEEEDGEGENEEDASRKKKDNDAILLINEKYKPRTLRQLVNHHYWVHVRPNILKQGRVVYFDVAKAIKEMEREAARRLKAFGEEEEQEEEEAAEEEEEEIEDVDKDDQPREDAGPYLLSSCNEDTSQEYTPTWTTRLSSTHNKSNRIVIMRSNVWPGAYAFAYENVCDNIYVGWGSKYTSRNMDFIHLPTIQSEYPHAIYDFLEATDPTFEMEEAVRLARLQKLQDDAADEVDEDDDDDDDDDFDDQSGTDTDV